MGKRIAECEESSSESGTLSEGEARKARKQNSHEIRLNRQLKEVILKFEPELEVLETKIALWKKSSEQIFDLMIIKAADETASVTESQAVIELEKRYPLVRRKRLYAITPKIQ
ncbi:hypothetical protein FQR65_LT07636 [Abscondita terminalis]|nr:hypothetical protein FQR65_LT07636 [Abscondita terminalis]